MKYLTKKNLSFILVVLIFLSGFYLRLTRYNYFNYLNGDEGNHFLLFDNFLRFKKFWLVGEGSSLGDYDQNLYFHNLPYSLYFELIIFIVANQSPLIYMFLYMLINLALIYLLWQTTKNFFDEKIALIAIFLASFSRYLIGISVFASQPTNALIFEAVGLYLLSLFNKKKDKKFLIFSLISFLFALHMYPPMYLYLPVKIIFLLIFFHKEIVKNKKILIYALLIIVISYLPMIINEINYFNQDCSNIWNIRSLINNGGFNNNNESVIVNDKTQLNQFLERIISLTRDAFNNINDNFYIYWLFLIPILFSAVVLNQDRNKKLLTYYFLLSILTPIIILGVFKIDRLDYIRGFNSFYLILVLAVGIGNLRKISKNLYFIGVSLTVILILAGTPINEPIEPELNHINYLERNLIIELIKNDIDQNSLALNEIDIKVINHNYPNNSGNWDSSIYWYLLQKDSPIQLVDCSYPFLTPEKINKQTTTTFYICEYKNAQANIQDCFNNIYQIYDISPEEKTQVLFRNRRLILIKFNHNLIQDEQ